MIAVFATTLTILSLVLGIAALVYLVYALIKPERF